MRKSHSLLLLVGTTVQKMHQSIDNATKGGLSVCSPQQRKIRDTEISLYIQYVCGSTVATHIFFCRPIILAILVEIISKVSQNALKTDQDFICNVLYFFFRVEPCRLQLYLNEFV